MQIRDIKQWWNNTSKYKSFKKKVIIDNGKNSKDVVDVDFDDVVIAGDVDVMMMIM